MTGAMPGQPVPTQTNPAAVAAAAADAQGTVAQAAAQPPTAQGTQSAMSVTEQMEALKSLKELLDAGILTQEEFNVKKRQILGLYETYRRLLGVSENHLRLLGGCYD
ncbi:hypothetical protein BAAM1489_01495 [Bifidobacterium animalis subsp. animalis MCC 1489]|uniref:Virion core protein n=1 Tax=Bifidobacterium animalis subsp. animalis IM386 TaxID=1402194 RepID=A0AAV2W1N4_9BIFI|nr:SHOCT domain-containing protein [Bifidobacterium animalis]AFI62827.1 Putative virion core protein [Bifidobacterium animalis subsp. animalis ATCC 25527]AYN23464.1 virion core protein [Bifidobacterium animalis subsp. animalis]KFI44411.1 virion core protein [Bifidobacterium animalis subsp. animalis]KOA64826.1 hypothetical protein BAAM1489_01495 [Bifidobacterium animalis subsp. animalis MCC 1489]CDI67581.1 Putative virion core protein [Bifidobacterium animalis subsp. animalis IM386]